MSMVQNIDSVKIYIEDSSSNGSNDSSNNIKSIHCQKSRTRQASLDSFMNALDGDEGPVHYSYKSLENYNMQGSASLKDSAFCDTLCKASKKILKIANSHVYLVDEKAFILESLIEEFPELSLFKLPLSEAFVESINHPGIWIETQRFKVLHCLSCMRREMKNIGIINEYKSIEIVKILLGFS